MLCLGHSSSRPEAKANWSRLREVFPKIELGQAVEEGLSKLNPALASVLAVMHEAMLAGLLLDESMDAYTRRPHVVAAIDKGTTTEQMLGVPFKRLIHKTIMGAAAQAALK